MRKITAGILGGGLIAVLLLAGAKHPINTLFWAPYANKAAALLYHQIDPVPDRAYAITFRLFKEHLDALLQNGYHVIPKVLGDEVGLSPLAILVIISDTASWG